MASIWKKIRVERFNSESIALVKETFIQSTRGSLSVVFKMKDGTTKYLPMSNMEKIPIDITLLEAITLQHEEDTSITCLRAHFNRRSKAPIATTESLEGLMSYGVPIEPVHSIFEGVVPY